ncbi:DUF3050 domain-containing protein [Pedobacter polaris]|uniref:DUF3050 domain-containing protein n=1 Tax=Pedobacter polaris TaxID=2571273 RepID=A0A4U1CET6_9SPHI|nr:DUF3050 domain-containing protein [Pedobacter polaris]TKC05576.1 DUF3050 domain-containing protein [Pedobacter polaris]
MNENLAKLQKAIEPLRKEIINHKVYAAIKKIDDLKIFMKYHIFAVWDFMSLLKSLQNNLTCTSIPWFPKGAADTRYLINEIVAGEESDIDRNGIRKSHFEMYLDAMKQCGADVDQIAKFVDHLKANGNLTLALDIVTVQPKAKEFVEHTFEVINSNKDYIQSAVFTFGREDLIPNMFISIVNDIHKNFPESISDFKYYLERHIEVDGDHHSHLALEMTAKLCGTDEQRWAEAEKASIESLQKRISLWDGVLEEIMDRKLTEV